MKKIQNNDLTQNNAKKQLEITSNSCQKKEQEFVENLAKQDKERQGLPKQVSTRKIKETQEYEIESNGSIDIKKQLVRKALGYTVKEKTEEYSVENGVEELIKKKVVTKHIPPDIAAYKLVLDSGEQNLQDYTDQELENIKNKLLDELNNEIKAKKSSKN
ncbi:MAG: hypothetical protein RR248_04075 [Clostridia bacterium]